MADSPSRPTPSGTSRLKNRRRKETSARARTAWLVAAIVLIFAGGVWLSGGGLEFARGLYSPIAVIVVIFLIIEYVVLKGRDRSRLYRIELERMRAKRRADVEFFRRLERDIQELAERLRGLEDSRSDAASALPAAPSASDLCAIRERLEDLRQTLSRHL